MEQLHSAIIDAGYGKEGLCLSLELLRQRVVNRQQTCRSQFCWRSKDSEAWTTKTLEVAGAELLLMGLSAGLSMRERLVFGWWCRWTSMEE